MAAAPYLYHGLGRPAAPGTVMSATGIKWFTMAFMLSGRRLHPGLGRQPPAHRRRRRAGHHADPRRRRRHRAVVRRLERQQARPELLVAQALAGAYQQVINAYDLKAIDIDIENTDEFENEAVQDRILNALKIVKQNNPRHQDDRHLRHQRPPARTSGATG